MIWNCPHCSTVVSLGIDIDEVKRAFVKCASCKGVALITRKADMPPPFRPLPESLRQEAENLADASAAVTRELAVEFAPPPAPPVARAPIMEPRITLDPQGAVQITPPAFLTQGALKKDEIPFEEATEEEKKAAAPLASVHQFEFRETRPSNRPFSFPKPPEFLTLQNDLLQGALKAVTEKLGPKRSRTPLTVAVTVAAVVAILSGVYLFIEGNKLLQESRRASKSVIRFSQSDIVSDSVKTGADAPARAAPPLKLQVRVPRAVLRSLPDVASPAVGQAVHQQVLDVTAWEGSWFKISFGKREAWIRNDLVRTF